jgi:2-polyprenyl-3-methyl-5-hydroxy-6-metoxy-1,4-benzoquinol methylase
VIEHGSLSPEENQQIYERWFLRAPRYLFRAVDRKYGITKKILCDVGCAYGVNLFYCASGSYGIDIQEHRANFAVSLDIKVYQRDVVKDDLSDLPRVDVVWCSAVLEHVDCPHIFLRKLAHLLRPKGMLALYVPTIPLFPVLQKLPEVGKYLSGYSANEHVNAFVPNTLQFCCERAGFRTIEISPFYPSILKSFNHIFPFYRMIGRCIYIGEKTED